MPPTVHIHPVVNVSKLQMYKSQVEGQKATKLAPVIVEGEEEFEVEKNPQQKENLREREIPGMLERLYSGGRHMGG